MAQNFDLPLVSVIIPTHDRRQYLEEAIDSVSRQKYTNWEIIVVDDVSEDGTWPWLETQTNDRIRCLRLDHNSGSTITRNAGLRMARGEYCLFLDDDDLLPEDSLALHIDAIRGHPDVIGTLGSVVSFDADGIRGRIRPTLARKVHDNIWRDIQFWWSFLVGASLFRTSIIKGVGGFDESIVFWGDDIDFWMRIGHLGPVALFPDPVIRWRYHGQDRPDNFLEMLREIGDRQAATWSAERLATTERILRARAALYDLRLKSGQRGNWIRITRLLRRAASCPYLLTSPISFGEMWRAIRRDITLDPWLTRIKRTRTS